MAMSAEHRSKFAALHRQGWRLYMSEKFVSGTKNPKQINKQTSEAYLGKRNVNFFIFQFVMQAWNLVRNIFRHYLIKKSTLAT